MRFMKAPNTNPAGSIAANTKAAPPKGSAKATTVEEVKPIIGRAWLKFD